jgi:uncharacterized protein YfaS (alpha-2-macroglobulin family)
MIRSTRWLVLTLAAALAAAGCTRGDRPVAKAPAGQGSAARALKPIPDAPAFEADLLPGSGGALQVVAARPTGRAGGEIRPTLTFSRPVVALGAIEEGAPPAPPATLDPKLEGEWRWLGSASVEFVPKGLVPYSTAFKVKVAAGLTALDGAKLGEPYEFEFQTPEPALQSATPADRFAWAAPDQRFTLLFNQPVKDLASHVRLEVNGAPVSLGPIAEIGVAEERRAAERGRPYPRASFEERNFKNRQTRYEFRAAASLPLDAPVTLTIGSSLAGSEGPLTMGSERRLSFRTYGPMKILSAASCGYPGRCTGGPLVLRTTNRLDLASLKGRLKIDPAVEIHWDDAHVWSPYGETYAEASLPGRFRPGTRYRIQIAAGALDEFKQAAPSFEEAVHFDDLEPSFSLGAPVAVIEADRDGTLPAESVNVTTAQAVVWALTPAELAQELAFASRGEAREPEISAAPVDLNLDLSGKPNAVRYTPVELRKALPDGKKTGLFLVKASCPQLKGPNRPKERVVAQVTNLAVHAKLGTKSGLLWVTDLSRGAPVEGARLTLLDRTGATKWEGVSDASGLSKVPGLSALIQERNDGEPPFALAVAQKDDDVGATLSSWYDGLHPSAFDLQSDWDDQEPKSLGLVFTDRGIYRPGDEVFVKGLARLRRVGDLGRPDPGAQVSIAVVSARGEKVHSSTVQLTDFGTFQDHLALGKDVSLGTYQVTAELTAFGRKLRYSGSFRVEEYRAPQFRVDVAVAQRDFAAQDPLKATVLARYLFGGAMAKSPVKWTASRTSHSFQPPGNEGFHFGVQTWWWNDSEPMPSSEVFGGGEGLADGQGAFAVEIGKAEAPAGKTYEYVVEAEVADVNRQRVANRATFTVHPAAAYAGVRFTSTGFAEEKKPVKIELVAASPDGKRVSGLPIAVEVKRRDWTSIRKKGVGDEWFTTSEPVETKIAECAVKSDGGPAGCEFTPERPGLHLIEATLTDAQGRKQITRLSQYVIGQGWASWQRNDSDRIDLVADKQTYEPGETARILVKSPYPEAEAILTVEREGVFSARQVHLKGSATTLEVPLDEALVPNAFVGILVVRGRVPSDQGIETGQDPGRPAVRLGYTELRVQKKSKVLSVRVTPDAAEKRPRDKVKVAVKVQDHLGKGKRSEVAIWAVDEGVLRLTNYQVPDPVEAVHPLRGLSVRVGEPLLHLVLARLYTEKGATSGGSGGNDAAGAGFRSQFKTTALFTTAVTDDGGAAQVEFELPDNLTTFRVMALAVTAGDQFGAGQSEVAVAKPLLALPALPRIARVGDKLEAGVVVHARGAVAGEVKVRAEVSGLALSGPAEKSIALAEGKPQEVRFAFSAEQEGVATLRFAVQGGGERDGVEQKIPVLLPVSTEAVATYGDTADRRVEGLVPPGGVRKGVGGLEVTLASTALGNFDENLRQLVEYPYGCVEQLSSRLVPFIALREIQTRFGLAESLLVPGKPAKDDLFARWLGLRSTLDLGGATDPDEIVRRTLRAIERLQNPDGGFRYWANDGCSSSWASPYAVLALARAKESGYPVDGGVLARGQSFLANTVAANRCVPCGWGRVCLEPGDPTRVFALYALARSNAAKASYYGELFARRGKLPLFSKAMLADAMFKGGGDKGQARQLLQEIMNFAKETPREVHFEEQDSQTYAALWSSDPRTTAIVLQTLTDLAPEHPYVGKIAAYLTKVRQGDGRYRNTQEAAFALMALTEVVRTKEKDVPDFVARVTLGKEELAQAPFKGRTMKVERAAVPIEKLADMKGQMPFAFQREGSAGVLYYGALLRYAPAELPVTPLDHGLVVQRWFEPFSGGGQSRQFFAGDLVRVRVRLGTPQERHFVALDVPLPAGLEPVDTSLASTARQPSAPKEEGPGEGYEYESGEDSGETGLEENPFSDSWYSPFNFTEMRDDRVVLFADHLPPGVHVASFVARATTPGDFVLKPAHAEEMYTPEVFGRSDGGRFQVALPAPVAER